MSTVGPPVPLVSLPVLGPLSGPLSGPGAPGLAQILTATILEPPPGILKLPQGAQIEVSVRPGGSAFNIDVEGAAGTFSLRGGALTMAAGTKLTLQVMQTTPQIQVRVVNINNQNSQPGAQGLGGSPGGPGVGGPNQGAGWGGAVNMPSGGLGGGAATVGTGGVGLAGSGQGGIAATVVRGALQAGQSGTMGGTMGGAMGASSTGIPGLAAGTLLPTGTQLVVRIASLQPQSQQISEPSVPQPGSTPQAGAPSSAFTSQASTATFMTTPPAASLATGLQGLSLPAAAPPPPPIAGSVNVPGSGNQPIFLSGVVAPNTMGSRSIVQTPVGLLALTTRVELPPGSLISLEIISQTPPPAPTAASPHPPLSAGQGWPALNEALSVLQRTDPMAAGQLNALIPTIGPRLVAAMIAAGAGILSGDARVWPGEATLKALERSGPRGAALAKKLGKDVEALGEQAKRASSTSGDEWRVMQMPFLFGQEIEKITLSVHNPGEDEDKKGSKGGARFLVDLNLSKMGPVQIDGLVRPEERRFDLVLRTQDALSQEVKRDLSGIFATSSLAMNMVGAVSFQVTPNFVTVGPRATYGGGSSHYGVVA